MSNHTIEVLTELANLAAAQFAGITDWREADEGEKVAHYLYREIQARIDAEQQTTVPESTFGRRRRLLALFDTYRRHYPARDESDDWHIIMYPDQDRYYIRQGGGVYRPTFGGTLDEMITYLQREIDNTKERN